MSACCFSPLTILATVAGRAGRIVSIALVLTVLGGASGGMGTYQAVAQVSDQGEPDARELIDCALLIGFNCGHVRDAQKWAWRVTDWQFPRSEYEQEDDIADAFRHCVWIGAVATRVGEDNAITIGDNHEDAAERNYTGDDHQMVSDKRRMDEANNRVGAGIGQDAVDNGENDQWGYVLSQCHSRAWAGELYGLDGVQGAYEH